MEYEGLIATPDHYVWIEGKRWPVQLGEAAACTAHLTKTGDGRRTIRLGEDNLTGKEMEQELESLLRFDQMYGMRKDSMAGVPKSEIREIKRLSELFAKTICDTEVVVQSALCSQEPMRKPGQSSVSFLRRERHLIQLHECFLSLLIFDGNVSTTKQKAGNRSDRQRWQLRTWKPENGNTQSESGEQKKYCSTLFRPAVLALFGRCNLQKTKTWTFTPRDYRGCRRSSEDETEALEKNICTARLYDVRNAGPNHRFTVSGKLVHNCGYGGSVGALKAMGAVESGMKEEELKPLVDAWRAANPKIVDYWWKIDTAVKECVETRNPTSVGNVGFRYKSGMLFIDLPSGRSLAYVKPRIEENQFGSESVTYMGVGINKKWERLESYGPKFVENIVHAVARDLLMESMSRIEGIVAHVHDEVIVEIGERENQGIKAIGDTMAIVPDWADGLVLSADGYECAFYKKD